MFVTLFRSVVFGTLVEKGRSLPDYQATSPGPGTLSERREKKKKSQGDAPWYFANTGMATPC